MPKLDNIKIAGFKSIGEQSIDLGRLNVMIGANGAGKSNLIGVFRLLNEIVNQNLQRSVGTAGGAEKLLHFGRKRTDKIVARLRFGRNAYLCELIPTAEDGLVFGAELVFFKGMGYENPYSEELGAGHEESKLRTAVTKSHRKTIAHHVLKAFESWKIFHFHDTSDSSRMKRTNDLADNRRLRADASNLAAFLYRLQETDRDIFEKITDTVSLVAPFFSRFDLAPEVINPDKIRLRWLEHGSDAYFDASALSDGTLRFICLSTLLLQPEPPTTVLIDEPELGLHPYAINVLADLLRSAATRTQILVSTQSVTLVNQLSPEEIIIVDRVDGASQFRRLDADDVSSWLDDYALGDLWEKNVFGGRPAA